MLLFLIPSPRIYYIHVFLYFAICKMLHYIIIIRDDPNPILKLCFVNICTVLSKKFNKHFD